MYPSRQRCDGFFVPCYKITNWNQSCFDFVIEIDSADFRIILNRANVTLGDNTFWILEMHDGKVSAGMI